MHGRVAALARPGFGRRQQGTADALPARRFEYDQCGELGERLRDQRAARFDVRKASQPAVRIDRDQHHARVVRSHALQPAQNGGRIRGIAQLAGKARQFSGIRMRRHANHRHKGILRKTQNEALKNRCERRQIA